MNTGNTASSEMSQEVRKDGEVRKEKDYTTSVEDSQDVRMAGPALRPQIVGAKSHRPEGSGD